jgi:hypothetical protein
MDEQQAKKTAGAGTQAADDGGGAGKASNADCTTDANKRVSPQTTTLNGQTYPLLPGFWDGGTTWLVPCDWCQKFHVHGAGPGHRVAHCERPPNGPYEASGYVLYLAGEWSTDVKEIYRRLWVDTRKAARAAKRALKEHARTERQMHRAMKAALRPRWILR